MVRSEGEWWIEARVLFDPVETDLPVGRLYDVTTLKGGVPAAATAKLWSIAGSDSTPYLDVIWIGVSPL